MESKERDTEEMEAAGLYLITLIRAALRMEKAEEKPKEVEWSQIYALAKRNSVEGISAYGVETLKEKPEDELWLKWKQDPEKTMYKVLHFDAEREEILGAMEEAGLSYLPLKGVHLAQYYPKPGMRTMADNDILYGFLECRTDGECQIQGSTSQEREKSLQRARKCMNVIMERRGYKIHELDGNHDAYHKKPFFNYEMHKRLIDPMNERYFYYENPWKRARRKEGTSFSYEFSSEDEYIYFLVHAYKHFSKCGCGVRLLTDLFVFQKEKGSFMDWGYISGELEKLKLTAFEKQITSLTDAVFGEEKRSLTEEERNLLLFLLHCGTYGITEIYLQNAVADFSKKYHGKNFLSIRYAWQRCFPKQQWWETYYPVGAKHRWIRPAILIYRIGKGLIIHPQRLWKEWQIFSQNGKNSAEK